MIRKELFYKRLVEAVQKTGKSVNQVERELGYPRNSLHNYKNIAEPSGSRLIELAQYFNVSPEYLIGGEDMDDPVILFQQLSEKQKLQIFKKAIEWGCNKLANKIM